MAILYPFSAKTHDLLSNPPEVGRGRHQWLFRLAVSLYYANWKPKKIEELLHAGCKHYGWTDRDGKTIDDILAKLELGLVPSDSSKMPPWPEPDDVARQARIATPSLFNAQLDTGLSAHDVLPHLFKPSELVCVGWSTFHYTVLPVEELLYQAHNAPFVVANPMRVEQDSNGSKRNKSIASRPEHRRFAVIEFDTGETREEQAAVLSSLHNDNHPLVLAVWSAGKSVHGWFNVSRLTPYLKLRFFRMAVWLGADESLFDMSKLVRMPGGSRDGRKQTILHWEPKNV